MSIRIYHTEYVCVGTYSFGLSEVIGDTTIWGAATSSTYHPSGRCCAINVIMFEHDDGSGGKNAIHCVISADVSCLCLFRLLLFCFCLLFLAKV